MYINIYFNLDSRYYIQVIPSINLTFLTIGFNKIKRYYINFIFIIDIIIIHMN